MHAQTTLSLGEILAQTKQEEADNTRRAAERKARQESEAELKKFRAVETFFETAKAFFETGIREQIAVRKLSIMVGAEYCGKTENMEVYHALGLSSASGTDPRCVKSGPYHSLWQDFTFWCAQCGLVPKWVYEWDGGGMSSWYQLKVEPAAAVTAASKFVNPNDVRKHHAYCLHVLNSTAAGLLKACATLRALPAEPRAQATLLELDTLLASTKAIHDQLNS